jgi:serine/threonine protein kinase/WD40 repeat protein
MTRISERLAQLTQTEYKLYRSHTDCFDERWREDPENPPDIEAFLPRAETLRKAVLIELVRTDLETRLRRGESVSVRHYCDRFPELQGDIAAQVELEGWQETLRPRASGIDEYEIQKEVGRGGFGIVYKAWDTKLKRWVALKELNPHGFRDEKARRRFLGEAQIVASLKAHPNLVSVYDLLQKEDAWYIVWEYCDGPSLADWLKEQKNQPLKQNQPLKPRTAAKLVATLASAMQEVHDQGIVHRDLTPRNILFHGQDPDGELPGVPKVTDFGLAKVLDSDYQLTDTGTQVGTKHYMSPEQYKGTPGTASDVWALGAILYELLTGELPFSSSSFKGPIELQVIEGEPLPPTQVNDRVPSDLETICLKCLQKDPSERPKGVTTASIRKALRKETTKRYATARELADDLERYLRDEPIWAKSPGILGWTTKWVRRNRAVAVASAALAVVSAALAGAIVINNELDTAFRDAKAAHVGEQKQRERADRVNKQLEQANKQLEFLTYARQVKLADTNLKAAEYGVAHRYLSESSGNFMDWEWHYLNRACRLRQDLRGDTGFVWGMVFSADGRSLVSVESDSVVRHRDRTTSQTKGIVPLQGVGFIVGSMTLSSDGRLVGAAGLHAPRDGDPWAVARIWDAATGRVVRTLYEDRGRYFGAGGMAFSSNGLLLTGMFDVWPSGPLGERPGGVGLPAGHPLRKALAWEVATGQELPLPRIGSLDRVVPSPDGKTVAIERLDFNDVIILELATARTVHTLLTSRDRFPGGRHVAFSPDGRFLAGSVSGISSVAGKSTRSWNEVALWELHTEKVVRTLREHPHRVERIAFGGKWLAVACEGNSTRAAAGTSLLHLYEAATGKLAYTLQGLVGVTAMAFAPDGQTLATASRADGTLKLWDMTDGLAYPGPLTFETGSLSPDGRLLEGGGLLLYWSMLWDAPEGMAGKKLPGHHPEGRAVLLDVAFSRDGSRIAAAFLVYDPVSIERNRAEVAVWDVSPPRVTRVFRRTFRAIDESVPRVALSPDGNLLAGYVATRDPVSKETRSDLILWDVKEDRLVHRRRGQVGGVIGRLAFCPDGQRVAFTTLRKDKSNIMLPELGTIALWDVGSNEVVATLTGHDQPVVALTLSADGGRTLVSGSSDGIVKLWDLHSGVSVRTLRGSHSISSIALHPSERRLAVGTTYGTVQVWSVDTGEELLTLDSGNRSAVENVSFSKSGYRLVSLSSEGTVKVWDGTPLGLEDPPTKTRPVHD